MLPLRSVLVLLIAGTIASAAAQTVSNAEGQEGHPNEYVTLFFPVSGSGEHEFVATAPEGWVLLTATRTLTLSGDDLVPATVKVPARAMAGTSATITMAARKAGATVVTAQGLVRVLPQAGIEVRAPPDQEVDLGAPVDYEILVFNAGNQRDRVLLSLGPSTWAATVSPPALDLEPFEARKAKVSLTPQGTVSSGYRYFLSVAAASSNDPDVRTQLLLKTTFLDRRARAVASGPDPTLVLGLKFGVSGTVRLVEDYVEADIGYSVQPSLEGRLSDYVTGAAATSPIAGTLTEPLPSSLGSASLSLKGEVWEAAARASAGNYDVEGSYHLGKWRFSAGAGYGPVGHNPNLRFSGAAVSADPGLDLQVAARLRGNASFRSDALSARYRRPIGEGLILGVGGDLSGSAGAESGYAVSIGLSESLSWQTQHFDLLQTATTVPFAGLYTLGLAGGTRSVLPFGVRASTSLVLSPEGFGWRNSATVTTRIFEKLILATNGTFETGNTPSAVTAWSVGPTLSWSLSIPGGITASLSGSYLHRGVITGDSVERDKIALQGTGRVGRFQLSASGTFEAVGATSSANAEEATTAEARLKWDFSSRTAVDAGYKYELLLKEVVRETHSFDAGWKQVWSTDIATRLGYRRTLNFVDGSSTGSPEEVNAALTVRNVLLEGLAFNFGYAISNPNGLFTGTGPPSHTVSFGLGYGLEIPFDTPQAITQVFGGRKSGELVGLAFRDLNMNGRFDEGEPPMPGLTVRVEKVQSITDASGRYRLLAPVGRQRLDFPDLPASFDLLGERDLEIRLNQTRPLDLPIVPVSTLSLELFDDADHNGIKGEQEQGIPYGGLRIEGPILRLVRTGIHGQAIVSGLIPGKYMVSPDKEFLPSQYQLTGSPLTVTIEAARSPAPVAIGAALPPREVESTFSAESLALFAVPRQQAVPAGAEVWIDVMVQGEVTSVIVEGDGVSATLTASEGTWAGIVRVPFGTPLGPLELRVHAKSQVGEAESTVVVNIIGAPLFNSGAISAKPGGKTPVQLVTLFRATRTEVLLPDGTRLTCTSTDGYTWETTWVAPAAPTVLTARVRADDRDLGELPLVVTDP